MAALLGFVVGSLFDPVLLLLMAGCGFARGWWGVGAAIAGSAAYGAVAAALVPVQGIGPAKAAVALLWTGIACLVGYLVRRRASQP